VRGDDDHDDGDDRSKNGKDKVTTTIIPITSSIGSHHGVVPSPTSHRRVHFLLCRG